MILFNRQVLVDYFEIKTVIEDNRRQIIAETQLFVFFTVSLHQLLPAPPNFFKIWSHINFKSAINLVQM